MSARRAVVALASGLLSLSLTGCGDLKQSNAVEMPDPIDAASLPVGPRVRVDQVVGLSEDAATEWARQSGWDKVEVVSGEFFELSSSPSERILLTVRDGIVVEAWAG